MYLEEFLNKTRCKWPWVLATSGAWARPHPVQGHFQESYCCSELSLWPVCSVPDHHGAKPRKEFRDHRAPAAWDTEHSAESKPEAGAVLFSFWELLPSSGFHEEDRAGHASVLESAPAWNRFSPGASGWSAQFSGSGAASPWQALPIPGEEFSLYRCGFPLITLICCHWSIIGFFSWAPKSLWMVTAAMKLKGACSLEGKLWQISTAY